MAARRGRKRRSMLTALSMLSLRQGPRYAEPSRAIRGLLFDDDRQVRRNPLTAGKRAGK